MACKDYNDLSVDTAYRKVYDYEGGSWKEKDGTYSTDCFMYHDVNIVMILLALPYVLLEQCIKILIQVLSSLTLPSALAVAIV